MLSRLLLGEQVSPQRKICVVLAVILVLLGIAIVFKQGAENWTQGVLLGVAFIVLGLATVAVLARWFVARDQRVATSEQLERIKQQVAEPPAQPFLQSGPADLRTRLSPPRGGRSEPPVRRGSAEAARARREEQEET